MSTIVTRYGKGSPLTWLEVDNNFTNLNTDKIQSGDTVAALTITSATINGGSINGTTVGASTASSGAFTTLSVTGSSTLSPDVVISGSSSNAALRITQTGAGDALLVEDSANPDATPFVINAAGAVLIAGGTNAGQLHVIPNSNSSTSILIGKTTPNEERFSRLGFTHYDGVTPPVTGFNFFSSSTSNFLSIGGGSSVQTACTTIVFRTAANNTTSAGTERLRIDSSGNVGIGTTSPAAKLDIGSGNLNFSSTAQRITGDFTDSTNVNNRVLFQTSTTNGVTNLGVIPNGTSTTSALQAYNNSDTTNSSFINLVATNTSVDIRSTIRGTGTYIPLLFSTGGSERMRIDTSGNVGIGTATPGARLHLSSTAAATGMRITDGTTLVTDFYANTSVMTLNAVTAIPLTFGTNNTERMRIHSSGGVSIGNTTDSGAASLNVSGSMSGGYIAHADGTTAMAFGADNVVRVTPNATATYTSTVPAAGAICVLSILTSGTTSYTITFGTGFKSTGTLATGTVSARYFNITFVSDGTNLIETSRTVAIA